MTCRTVLRVRQWMHQTPATEGESWERTQDMRLTMRHRADAQADAYSGPLGRS